MLNGLYDAKLDHMPVLAIVGQQGTGGLGGATQQETDLHSMLKDVASAYVETIATPEQVRHVIDRAVRIALAERTVTAMILPHDVQTEEAVAEPPREHGEQHSSVGYTPPRVLPQQAELERAAEVLNAGKRVAMLVGAGAHARDGRGDRGRGAARRRRRARRCSARPRFPTIFRSSPDPSDGSARRRAST